MTERCRTCRFWLLNKGEDADEKVSAGFGWCRRRPPQIIDHMARIAIRTPGFGGHVIDPEDVASCSTIHETSFFPATFGTEWCGEFEQVRNVTLSELVA